MYADGIRDTTIPNYKNELLDRQSASQMSPISLQHVGSIIIISKRFGPETFFSTDWTLRLLDVSSLY